MPIFTVNPNRFDPYKNFKFRLRWDGHYVAGVSKMSALKRTTQVVTHREGGDPSSSRTEHDERLPQRVWTLRNGAGTEVSLADFRKDITIETFNESGQKVLAYHVFRCWVSEYQALPEHDANANAVAIQTIKLENEGWQRDTSVIEPAEPTLAS